MGLVSATIMMGLLSGMKIAELTGAISGGFGSTMTSTGLVIIFGCIFGEMLGSSGALEEIAKFLLRKVGSKHDYLAINLLGYVVSIPVYFGSAYVMLSPLLNSLQKLTNKKMTGYVNALFVGRCSPTASSRRRPVRSRSRRRSARTSAGSSSTA